MRIVHKRVDFLRLEAIDLHADCGFIAVLCDEIVKEHASVDVLPEYFIDSEALVLFPQKRVNFLKKMVDNNIMFFIIFDFVIFAFFLLSFGIHLQYILNKTQRKR